MSNKRLQHRLEMQAMQIEEVFSRHELPTRVAGGRYSSRRTHFSLQAQIELGVERLRSLRDELKGALRVPDVAFYRVGDAWRVDVVQDPEPAVPLLDLLNQLPAVPPVTAALGWAEEQRPVLLNLRRKHLAHVMISGDSGAGKTALLKASAISLALLNKQAQVQMVVVDCPGRPPQRNVEELSSLNYLPHLLRPVVDEVEDGADLLDALVDEMQYRQQHGITTPAIVVLVDKVVSLLLEGGQPVLAPLTRLLQRGDEVGIHLILGTRRPQAEVLNSLLRTGRLAYLVGQMAEAQTVPRVAGRIDFPASSLLGQGDFVAVVNGTTTRFQAAYLGAYDMRLSLETVHRRRAPVLIARPLTVRNRLVQADTTAVEPAAAGFVVGNHGDVMLLGEEEVKK